MASTVFVPLPSSIYTVRELTTTLDFKDEIGRLVHVTKEQLLKPFKGMVTEYTDRGLAGTGNITDFKSSLLIDNVWKTVDNPLTIKIEGAELAVTTRFDSPLYNKKWSARRFEFDCIDCFTEKEESFIYRVDNPTELFKITFNFHLNRKPEVIKVYEVIGGYKDLKSIIEPSYSKSTEFEWSIKKPHLASEYLFLWTW
jgi:hypothetical protein